MIIRSKVVLFLESAKCFSVFQILVVFLTCVFQDAKDEKENVYGVPVV